MIKGIIFDYDGTISPTNLRQYKWFKFWAKDNGKKLPHKNFDDFMNFYNPQCNKGGVQSVYDALGLPCNMNDKNHPVWNSYERFKKENSAGMYEGMTETLIQIWNLSHLTKDIKNNKRTRIAINSSNTWNSIKRDLDKTGLLYLFDSFVTEEVLTPYAHNGKVEDLKKPNTLSLELSLNNLGTKASETIHIGDTLTDLIASKNIPGKNGGNLITLGAGWGYEGKEKLKSGVKVNNKKLNFDKVLSEPKELLEVIKEYF